MMKISEFSYCIILDWYGMSNVDIGRHSMMQCVL